MAPIAAASENPDVAVIRTLPATSETVAGRACAKRMKTPYQCCSLLLRNDIFGMEWHGRRGYACLVRYALHSTLGALRRATRRSYPVDGNVITPRSRTGDLAACRTTAQTVRGRPEAAGVRNHHVAHVCLT